MKRKRLIAGALALVLSTVGAGSLWWYASTADQRALQGLETTGVFVATADIPIGTTLGAAVTGDLLMVQQIPKRLAPAGATTSVDSATSGYLAVSEIRAGELVTLTRFAPQAPAYNPLALPQGMVAVAVDVADAPRVGNFTRPGSHVAVFLTYPASDKIKATRLLLDDVLVLAIGDSTDTTPGITQAPSNRVTVALDQRDAQKLIKATTFGTLYTVLLNDESVIESAPATTDDNLFG